MIRVKNNKKNSCLINMDNFKFRKSGIVVLAAMLMSGVATTAHAGIDNSATASGTYDGDTVNAPASTATVPVVLPSRELAITPTGTPEITITAGVDTTFADASDTVTFYYKVENKGNITEAVTFSVANKPSFTPSGANATSVEGTGNDAPTESEVSTHADATGVASALAPGEFAVFKAVYTMTDLDAFRAADVQDGISLVGSATGGQISNTTTPSVNSVAAKATIDPVTGVSIEKYAYRGNTTFDSTTLLTSDSTPGVDEGDIVTYKYLVTNTGNVPLSNVSITDVHEGVTLASGLIGGEVVLVQGVLKNTILGSTGDGSNDNGIIELLAGGAEVTLTYEHEVTPAEILAQ